MKDSKPRVLYVQKGSREFLVNFGSRADILQAGTRKAALAALRETNGTLDALVVGHSYLSGRFLGDIRKINPNIRILTSDWWSHSMPAEMKERYKTKYGVEHISASDSEAWVYLLGSS